MRRKENGKVNKPIRSRRWVYITAAVILVRLLGSAIGNGTETASIVKTEETTEEVETSTLHEAVNESKVRSICRALTSIFVKNVVKEEFKWFSAEEYEYELDENGDGIINVLYMPHGLTKVNLTITKNGNVYTIKYALLSGLYEVDMDAVPNMYKVIVQE